MTEIAEHLIGESGYTRVLSQPNIFQIYIREPPRNSKNVFHDISI